MIPIGKACFGFHYLFSQIHISDSIQELTEECFNSCYSLSEIDLSQSMRPIGKACFGSYYLFSQINIPDSIQ
jgi:hypothetical protein